ncbi:MAG: SMP-30/gluconolactonase/LRE family protein [Mycobacteriales bacterium]
MTSVELVCDARAELAEGPVWDRRTDELVWTDILAGAVHWLDPSTGKHRSMSVGQPVGALAMRAAGGYVLALRDGIAVLSDVGELTFVSDVCGDQPSHRFNDAKCDANGCLWAGTLRLGSLRHGNATLFRIDAEHVVKPVLTGIGLSNGLGWSPDGKRMYFIDSLAGVDVFDFDERTGDLTARRRLVTIPADDGLPDGMCVDSDGYLWVAVYGSGEIRRYSSEGELDRVIALPVSNPTSCAFGGTNLTELYITTARKNQPPEELAVEPMSGGIFRCCLDVQGLPSNMFAG